MTKNIIFQLVTQSAAAKKRKDYQQNATQPDGRETNTDYIAKQYSYTITAHMSRKLSSRGLETIKCTAAPGSDATKPAGCTQVLEPEFKLSLRKK